MRAKGGLPVLTRAVVVPLVVLLAVTPGAAQTGTSGAAPGKTDSTPATPGKGSEQGQLIVGLKAGVTDTQANALWKSFNVKVVEKLPQLASYVIAVPPGRIDKVEQELRARPEVDYVERNLKHSPASKK
jgi:hypothetical protein